jgi:CDP-glucose 4,6-dehydratase
VGGWLVKDLLACDADLIILLRDHVPRSLFLSEGLASRTSCISGGLDDLRLLERVLTEYAVKTVFHLGAQTLVGNAKTNPVETLEANIRGTWNLLEACRRNHVSEIVVASSDKAYGDTPALPYREDHPLAGRYPYDCSKSCTDLISRMYATTYSLPVSVTRCANIFGGGDLNFSRMIPDLIRATLQNEQFVIRSDGQFVRDFLYVRDAVAAYLCVAENLAANPSIAGEAFNFSLEVRVTVLDLVQKVLALMDRSDLQPLIQNRASSEIREQYMVCGKARSVLGWSPRFSLEEGLRETIDWYRARFEATNLKATAAAAS